MSKEQLKSAGLAILYNNKLLLGHQRGRKPNEGYGIPKGLVDPGESLEETAIRETQEEFGLDIDMWQVKSVNSGTFNVYTSKYNKTVWYYVIKIDDLKAIGLNSEIVPKNQLQLSEVTDARFMDYEEAKQKITKSQKELCENLFSK